MSLFPPLNVALLLGGRGLITLSWLRKFFFNKRKAKTGAMAWKVDLAKAYDRLLGSFLVGSLRRLGCLFTGEA